jgi:ubiquinone/menaquinone biosynthesis C-methylase UbiE
LTSANVSPTATTPTGNAYDKYGVEHPIERRLVDGFLRALDEVLPEVPPARVLEVGVGEGEISARVRQRYPEATVVGIDLLDLDLAEEWRRRGGLGAFADVTRLPFPDDTFDLVLGIEVLEHVPAPDRALKEIRRVGRDSFVLSVPREPIWRVANVARGRYVRQLGNTPGHVNHWTSRQFRKLVDAYVDVQATRTPFPWTVVSGRLRTRS